MRRETRDIATNVDMAPLGNSLSRNGSRRKLRRALSDTQCPELVSSSEELLLKSVHENLCHAPDLTTDVDDMLLSAHVHATPIEDPWYDSDTRSSAMCNCTIRGAYGSERSLDRRHMRRVQQPPFHSGRDFKRHTYSCEQNWRILQKIEKKALMSMQKQQHRSETSGSRGNLQYLTSGEEHILDDTCVFPGTSKRLGSIRHIKQEYQSPAGTTYRRAGTIVGEADLLEDEIAFDISGGQFAECQCAFPYESDSFRSLQAEHQQQQQPHCFPPAPDVTRQMGSSGGGGSVRKPEVTFYRPPARAACSNSSSSGSGSSRLIELSWRQWWIVGIVLLLAAAAGVGVPLALRVSAGASWEERLELASRFLQEAPLIDGHNDLPWNIRKFVHNRLRDFRFGEDLRNITPWSTSAWSHTDLPRLKRGHVAAQFWAAYVPCESQHRDAVQLTLEQIDIIRRLTDQYYPQLTLCTSAEEIRVAHQRHQLCSLIGVEGGHSLANSLAVLRILYQVGVRYLTLTSTCNTPWADCSLADIPGKTAEHGGLTTFGKTVVKEMNRLGMIVDLSHVSVRTMSDALAASKAPVIFSHSSARALCNSTRNVPDATLRRLALNKGLVMVNFYSNFLTCDDTASVSDAVAHINHIRDVAGVDNVGIGAGYDGINHVPKGLEDASTYPALFAELMATGRWSAEDLKKLAGLNFLRVMGDVERVRDEFKQAKVPPYEDVLPVPRNNNCSSNDLF